MRQRTARHGEGAKIEFQSNDFEILDMVLDQVPELRICATVIKRARIANIVYPIERSESLHVLFSGETFEGGGHRFGVDAVTHFMPTEFFPISNERELVSRVYIALVRCKHEDALAAHSSVELLRSQRVIA